MIALFRECASCILEYQFCSFSDTFSATGEAAVEMMVVGWTSSWVTCGRVDVLIRNACQHGWLGEDLEPSQFSPASKAPLAP